MEARDEQERYEGKVLSRDLPPMTAEQLALRALIETITGKGVQGNERATD